MKRIPCSNCGKDVVVDETELYESDEVVCEQCECSADSELGGIEE